MPKLAKADPPTVPTFTVEEANDICGFVDDLLGSNLNILGRSVLQDYARFNRAMLALERWRRSRPPV